MTSTWLDFCIRLDGPKEKQGYPGVSSRTLSEIEGEVDHSTEGPLSAALGELQKLERQASWHFTVPKSGPPLQHYPLEAITWHAGLPGDRRVDTSLLGNLTLIGVEHVDWPDNILNDSQLHWSVELTKAFRGLCPRIAARPPILRVNLWEHNWLSPTSCPSGLIPWAKKLAALEDEMTDAEFLAALQRILRDPAKAATLGLDNTLIGRSNLKDYIAAVADGAVGTHAALPHGGAATHTHPLSATI